jgi:hypothetical protein
MTGMCKYKNETSGSIKGRKFVYRLSKYQLFKTAHALVLTTSV